MRILMAPLRERRVPTEPSVFLAGSIDMGSARNWQKDFEKEFEYFPITVYNPRRDDWDSSWKQTDSDPQFREQVEWELDFMKHASDIFMFVSNESKAPITLLEFGAAAMAFPQKLTVCFEPEFYRRGNIEVVCRRNGIPLYDNFKQAAENLKIKIAARL